MHCSIIDYRKWFKPYKDTAGTRKVWLRSDSAFSWPQQLFAQSMNLCRSPAQRYRFWIFVAGPLQQLNYIMDFSNIVWVPAATWEMVTDVVKGDVPADVMSDVVKGTVQAGRRVTSCKAKYQVRWRVVCESRSTSWDDEWRCGRRNTSWDDWVTLLKANCSWNTEQHCGRRSNSGDEYEVPADMVDDFSLQNDAVHLGRERTTEQ